jgi:hypothetical protein
MMFGGQLNWSWGGENNHGDLREAALSLGHAKLPR